MSSRVSGLKETVRIQAKIFLTIVVSSIIFTCVMLLLVQWSLDRELLAYANQRQIESHRPLAEELSIRYEEDRWQKLISNPHLLHEISRQYGSDHRKPPPPRGGKKGKKGNKGDGRGPGGRGKRGGKSDDLTLLAADRTLLAGPRRELAGASHLPIRSGGEVVGYLVFPKLKGLTDDFDLNLRDQQYSALALVGLVVIVLSAIVALFVSPTIVRPIRQIAAATNRITHGNYEEGLNEKRTDELGELARDVNELATALKESEQTRQRWLADTSHELRTPLAIIKGEIEAMLDGVRALNTEHLKSLQQEVDHLQKLVDDLTDLSNADIGSLRYHKEWLSVSSLIENRKDQYEEMCREAGLTLTLIQQASNVEIYGDEQRLNQLLDNLISNSCKYTESGGQVIIDLSEQALVVEDSAPGVPDEALSHIFDHLYRVDSSRNRKTGGSGLGLAIAARIVEGHNASIEALHSPLGGVRIRILLPTEDME